MLGKLVKKKEITYYITIIFSKLMSYLKISLNNEANEKEYCERKISRFFYLNNEKVLLYEKQTKNSF